MTPQPFIMHMWYTVLEVTRTQLTHKKTCTLSFAFSTLALSRTLSLLFITFFLQLAHTHAHAHALTCIHTQVGIFVCVSACVFATHTHAHARARPRAHAHKHTHTHSLSPPHTQQHTHTCLGMRCVRLLRSSRLSLTGLKMVALVRGKMPHLHNIRNTHTWVPFPLCACSMHSPHVCVATCISEFPISRYSLRALINIY